MANPLTPITHLAPLILLKKNTEMGALQTPSQTPSYFNIQLGLAPDTTPTPSNGIKGWPMDSWAFLPAILSFSHMCAHVHGHLIPEYIFFSHFK